MDDRLQKHTGCGEATVSETAMSIATLLRDDAGLGIERVTITSQGVYMMREVPGLPSVAGASGDDPLLLAIQAFRDGISAYNAASTGDDEADDEAAERTYVPPLVELEAWTEPAVTRRGAVEALRFALVETRDFGLSETVRPMLRAALAYFDGQTIESAEDKA